MAPTESTQRDPAQQDEDASIFSDAQEALWRDFEAADSLQAFCAAWLALQCRLIGGVAGGMVLLGQLEETRPLVPVAFWPDQQHDLRHLSHVTERAVKERRGLAIKRQLPASLPSRSRYDLAYPIQITRRICGVVALDLDWRSEVQIRAVMRQLQWGSGWMEVLLRRNQSAALSLPQDRLQATVAVVAMLVSQTSFQGSTVALVTELATRLGCDRVSIGFMRRGSVQVSALSHSAQFGKNTNLVRTISAAMEEAIDQDELILLPAPPDRKALVARAHAELSRQSGNACLCSIPLHAQDDTIGVLTFERASDQPFDQGTLDFCEALCALVGPILEVRRREDRWVFQKVLDSVHDQLAALIGPRHVATKLGVSLVAAVVLFCIFVKGEYRVTSKTVIEPATRQAVVAGFSGYIAEAPLRAGDVTKKGQLMAKLDDRELALERGKWHSQQEQSQRQYYEALGNGNAPQVQILTAQIAQARAQVALLDEELARTEIRTPLDGVIVTGDLSQSIGAPVERGQVLFELAPLNSYRIVLQVDERDIGNVAVGQRGQLVLSGFPSDPLDFSVGRLTPISTASEGRNFFAWKQNSTMSPSGCALGWKALAKFALTGGGSFGSGRIK
ncbi:MAG: HlyD family efflux transporter periplasmic adaptor subunit [Acidobacteria bacterium]|nr:HlyD family efflux transporter periplasmic adaptor subunit [Acidobacteriota bacterium]